MTDPAAAWLASMIRHGETAITLRQAGHTWNEISDALHLGDKATAQRAAALYLAADYESRTTHAERAGEAQDRPATSALPDAQRTPREAG